MASVIRGIDHVLPPRSSTLRISDPAASILRVGRRNRSPQAHCELVCDELVSQDTSTSSTGLVHAALHRQDGR